MTSLPYTSQYPANWPKVSRVIRRLANGRCERCGQETPCLSVHHSGAPFPDGREGNPRDKHDLRRENLISLCFECHDAIDHIKEVRAKKLRRLRKREAKIAKHRALGIGTGLVVCSMGVN